MILKMLVFSGNVNEILNEEEPESGCAHDFK